MLIKQKAADGYWSLKYKGQWLYSAYKPIERAERCLPPIEEGVLYVCPSPLLGYGLDKLLQQLPSSSACLWVEQDEELRLCSIDALKNYQQLIFIEATSSAFYDIVSLLPATITKVVLLVFNAGYLLHQSLYNQFFKLIEQYFYHKQLNSYTIQQRAKQWLNNIKVNISHLHTIVEPDFSNETVVIAAAGPSLEGLISNLVEHRANYRLLAVDTALPALMDYQLKPDAVFVLEGGYHNLKDFYRYYRLDAPLIYDLSAYPATSRMTVGCQAVFCSRFAELALFKQLEQCKITVLPPLGSVAVAAVGYLLAKGAAQIILAGTDFSYYLDKSHARGCYSYDECLLDNNRLNRWPMLTSNLKRPLVYLKKTEQGAVYTDTILQNYATIVNNAQQQRLKVVEGGSLYPLQLKSITLKELPVIKTALSWQQKEVSPLKHLVATFYEDNYK